MYNRELQNDFQKHGFKDRELIILDDRSIISTEGTVTTKYKFKSKKQLQRDWQELNESIRNRLQTIRK